MGSMSDPTAAVRIAYDRDHDVGEAALRGMRIELAAWLTDEIYECNWLLLRAARSDARISAELALAGRVPAACSGWRGRGHRSWRTSGSSCCCCIGQSGF